MTQWQNAFIRRQNDASAKLYFCRVCGHSEVNNDGTSRAWGRMRGHVTQTHPEQRRVNK
jgi:hypothetical protein